VDKSLRVKKVVYCLVLLLSLTGCGYRPLYTSGSDGRGVVASLSSITIEETGTRAGQLVRNSLLSSIRPAGTAQRDRFKLILKPELVQSSLVSQSLPGIKRMRLRLTVSYELLEAGSGSKVNSGKTFSAVSYDIIREPVADLQAEANATDRAAQEVAADIRTRLAAYMAGRQDQ
jgi:LPS-assembly lipoprotein